MKILITILVMIITICSGCNLRDKKSSPVRRIDPERAIYHRNRGTTLAVLGDKEAAITEYNLAIEFDPNFANAFRCRGLIKIEIGQKSNGCEDLQKAKELGDDMAEYDIKTNCR